MDDAYLPAHIAGKHPDWWQWFYQGCADRCAGKNLTYVDTLASEAQWQRDAWAEGWSDIDQGIIVDAEMELAREGQGDSATGWGT